MGREVAGGWFKRERTYVYLWPIHVDVWQKITILYSNHPVIFKKKKKVKKKHVFKVAESETALLMYTKYY